MTDAKKWLEFIDAPLEYANAQELLDDYDRCCELSVSRDPVEKLAGHARLNRIIAHIEHLEKTNPELLPP
jgi:hypothetical protein